MAAPRHRLHVLEQVAKVHPGERVEQRWTREFYEGVNVEVARQKRVNVEVAQRKFLAGNQGKRDVVAAAPGERNMVKKTEPLAQLHIKIAPALRRAAALAEERSDIEFRAEGSRCVRAESRIPAAAAHQLIPAVKLSVTCGAPGNDVVFQIAPHERPRNNAFWSNSFRCVRNFGKAGFSPVPRFAQNGSVAIDPKLPFTTTLADGRVGWISASPLPGLQFRKRSFCLWPQAEQPLWSAQRQQADVRSWGLPTAAVAFAVPARGGPLALCGPNADSPSHRFKPSRLLQ